jgi:hypothetical protein
LALPGPRQEQFPESLSADEVPGWISLMVKNRTFLDAVNKEFATVVVVSLLVQFIFINSPGTSDVSIWLSWMEAAWTKGPIDGYSAVFDYPPLSYLILAILSFISHALNWSDFSVLKLALIFATTCSFFAAFMLTGSVYASICVLLICFVNGVLLGYLDVLYAPLLILTFYYLRCSKLSLATLFFSLSCLIKWQPLILFPFLFIYILKKEPVNWVQLLIIPLLLFACALLVFGTLPFETFKHAISHRTLSANALNFMWLFSVLSNIDPLTSIQKLGNTFAPYSSKVIFLLMYSCLLLVAYRRTLELNSTVYYGILGFLSYYVFNYGVHENHLFVPAILAVLFVEKDLHFFYGYTAAMAIINMVVFYGFLGSFDEKPDSFYRLTAALSLLNVIIFTRQFALEMTRRLSPRVTAKSRQEGP